jgi:hypothetical protein
MLGSIVYYRLTEIDATQINRRRTTGSNIVRRIQKNDPNEMSSSWPIGAQAHIGNEARVGQIFPMLVVRVSDAAAKLVSGQVFLDGNDVLWVQDIHQGDHIGHWCSSV